MRSLAEVDKLWAGVCRRVATRRLLFNGKDDGVHVDFKKRVLSRMPLMNAVAFGAPCCGVSTNRESDRGILMLVVWVVVRGAQRGKVRKVCQLKMTSS